MTRVGVVKQTLRNVLINFKFSLPRPWTLFRPSLNRAKAQNQSLNRAFPYSWDANGTLDVIISNINFAHKYTWYVYMHLIHVPSLWPRFTSGQGIPQFPWKLSFKPWNSGPVRTSRKSGPVRTSGISVPISFGPVHSPEFPFVLKWSGSRFRSENQWTGPGANLWSLIT